MIELKALPNDIQAEQALLCALINDPACRPKVRAELVSRDFYRESHRHLFEIISLDSLDLTGIYSEVQRQGLSEKCGGQEYLMELAASSTGSAYWQHYAKTIKDLAARRQIINHCQITMQRAFELHNPTDDVLSEHHKALLDIEIEDPYKYKAGVSMDNVYDAEKCLAAYREYIKTLKRNRFITGISEIDRRIRGVSGGEVLFIIARGGTFKTAILQNLLKNYINNSKWGAVFFSIEMPIASVTERYHEIIQGSSGRDIEEFYTTDRDGVKAFLQSMEHDFREALKDLFIVERKVSIKDTISYIKLIQTKKKMKIGLVGVDYLGLMDGKGKGEYEIISNLAKDMKNLAKLLNIPVIVISQTSRRAGSGNVEIELDMARGSGVIEEAADFILGLWEDEEGLVCKILKNRKGVKGSCWMLDLEKENLRLGNQAKRWTPKKKTEKSWQDNL